MKKKQRSEIAASFFCLCGLAAQLRRSRRYFLLPRLTAPRPAAEQTSRPVQSRGEPGSPVSGEVLPLVPLRLLALPPEPAFTVRPVVALPSSKVMVMMWLPELRVLR